jgi:translation initiation factor 3 subunit B
LIVDGIPIIDKSKLEKLLAKICKDFGKKGVAIKPDDIFMPWHEKSGKNKGYGKTDSLIVVPLYSTRFRYLFIDFKSVDDASFALSVLQNHAFDTRHTFKFNRFSDVETFADLDETYIEPGEEEYIPKVT